MSKVADQETKPLIVGGNSRPAKPKTSPAYSFQAATPLRRLLWDFGQLPSKAATLHSSTHFCISPGADFSLTAFFVAALGPILFLESCMPAALRASCRACSWSCLGLLEIGHCCDHLEVCGRSWLQSALLDFGVVAQPGCPIEEVPVVDARLLLHLQS